MKVKEIILSAAVKLGISKGVEAYFSGEDNACEREAELLLEALNTTETDLALNYLPLYAEDVLYTTTGALQYDAFKYSPIRIVEVKNGDGEKVAYKHYPKYLKVEAGEYTVVYTYAPNKKGVDEDCECTGLAPASLLIHGLLSEYCLAEGRFEEASAWDKKYKDGIEAIYKLGSCKRLKSRRWV